MVVALTRGARLLAFPLGELKEMAKGKGLTLIDLAAKDELVGVAVSDGEPLSIHGSGRGGKPAQQRLSAKDLAGHVGGRARRGHDLGLKMKPERLANESNGRP